jgi:hypothetical protein
MTPARRETLTKAIALIEATTRADAWDTQAEATRQALADLGAEFTVRRIWFDRADLRFSVKLAGVAGRCDFDKGEHLLLRWAANARTALAEGTDDNGAQ